MTKEYYLISFWNVVICSTKLTTVWTNVSNHPDRTIQLPPSLGYH